VTVSDINGCTDDDSVTVNVNPLPIADAGADDTICFTESAVLTASGGINYIWDTGATTSVITVSPTITTTYTVTVTDVNGCTDEDSVTITVNPLPIANAGADQTICDLDNATLTATGGTSYLWNIGSTTASITVNPSTTTTYSVTVSDSNGCSAEDSVTVNVNPIPNADAGADDTICNGDNAVLTASGGISYVWDNGAVTDVITVSPTATTTYTVTVTDVNGCTDNDSVTVNVNPLPIADAGIDQTICIVSSTILNASGGVGYVWDTGETTASITVSPVATTTYFVTVTDANGCTDDDSVTVTVNLLPIADAGADQTICNQDSAILNATGGTLFEWNTGETTASITVNPTTTTTYSVTVSDANGCSAEDNVVVNVNPLPVADAGIDQTICNGFDATLTASGGISYQWSTGEVTAAITVAPTTTTNYQVTVTAVNGCTALDDVTVNVNTLPTADAGPDQSICLGFAATFNATGGVDYLWSTTETTPGITVVPIITTTYSVTVTDASGCSSTDAVTVTVNPLPVADAGTDQTICNQDSATLTATGGSTYEWSTTETTATITVTPSTTTTYTVTVTDVNGCTDDTSVVVNVNPLPVADAGTDQTICIGFDATLAASGGTSYQWSTGETTAAITVAPIATTNYQVTVTDANGCTDEDDVTVNVNPLPIADAGPDQSICLGFAATFNATGGVDYVWSTGETTPDITVVPMLSTTYTVTVTDAVGCSSTDDVAVTVNPLPIADAGTDQTICDLDSATLTASGGVAYEWSTAETTATITVTPSATTTYFVTVTDVNGCTDDASVTVNVNPIPVADAGSDQSLCEGTGTVTLSAIGGGSYVWSTGETTSAITVSPASTTTYSVTVTDAIGCSDEDNITVTVGVVPIADAGADQSICEGNNATLIASGGVSFVWSTGETSATINVTPALTTTYTVTVTSANGCTAEDSAIITVNPIPVADAGANQNICELESATLTASGGIDYLWDTGETTNSISVTPATTTLYTVTVTDVNGCTDEASVSVNVNLIPIADAGVDQSLCEGIGSVTLTASGGATYLWSTTETSAVISVSPTTTTVYTVTVTSANGCTAMDNVTVFVGTVPVANAGADQTVCQGALVNLTVTGIGTYSWSTGETSATISVTPSTTTTYSVTVTNSDGCTNTDAVIVNVNTVPVADAGSDQNICEDVSVTLTASGGDSYLWDTGATNSTITVTPTATTTYSVTVSLVNGCTDEDSVTVNVTPLPIANAGPDVTICDGGFALLTATGGGTYLWNTGETTFDLLVTPLATTTYNVTVTCSRWLFYRRCCYRNRYASLKCYLYNRQCYLF
jgi:predicted transcriptional regulator